MDRLNRITILATFLFVTTAFGACLDVGGKLEAPEPVWASGYVFAFKEHGSYRVQTSGSGPDGGESRDQEETFGPNQVVYEVLNTTLTAASGEPAYLIAFARLDREKKEEAVRVQAGDEDFVFEYNPDRVTLGALRQRDLQDLPVGWDVDGNCQNRICRTALKKVLIGAGPQWTFLDFPLKDGKDWTASMTDDAEDFDDIKVRMTASVGGRAKASTPLGSLSAVRVDFDFRPEDVEAFKQQIRKEAEEDGDVEIRDFDFSLRTHVTIYYSPVYQNVVRIDRTFDQTFRVSGSEEGEDFNFAFENHVEFHRELTGARLVSHPERDLSGIGRVLLGDVPIADPSGAAFRPVGYTVQIEADQERLNVAEEGAGAHYKAVLKGVQQLPEDHQVHWRVVDGFGRTVAAQTGAEFDFQPETAGLFVVEAETRDASGNVTSADAAALAANFIATKRAVCPTVAIQNQVCENMQLPVRPGITSLSAKARVTGPLAGTLLSAGVLRLRDAEGSMQQDATRNGNEYAIELNEFTISGVSDRDWSLDYVPRNGVMEGVEYSVELLYGPSGAGPMPTGSRTGDRMLARLQEQLALQTGEGPDGPQIVTATAPRLFA